MKHNLSNSYDEIILKPMTEKESELFRVLRNRDENRNKFLYSEPISKESQIKWFENYLERDEEYMFSAYHRDNPEQFIGAVSIYNIKNGRGEFGRIIVDKQQIAKKGIGVMIAKCVCQIAFKQLALQSLVLEVFSDNIAAIKTYEKVGFKKTSEIDNDNQLLFGMELLKEEFENVN